MIETLASLWAGRPPAGLRARRDEPDSGRSALRDRIAAVDAGLRAFTLVAPDRPGPFDPALPPSGILVAVKDIIDVEGRFTRAGG